MRPRLLFLTDSYPHDEKPYITPFFHDHAKAVQSFADVKVLTLIRGDRFGFRRYVWDGVEVEAFLMPYRPKMGLVFLPLALILHALLLLRGLIGFRPDAVVVHMALPSGLAASALLPKRFAVVEHSSLFARGANALLSKIVYRLARRVFTVSTFLARELRESLGVEADGVIPNPIRPCHLPSPTGDSSTVLWIGRITPVKDPILLKEAARLLPDLRFIFVGEASDPKYTREFLRDLPPNCEYLGPLPREDVLQLMGRGDVLVSTSTYETFGVVMAEALACGRPVVWTDSGGPRDFLNEGNSVSVRERTPQALAEAISEALSKLRSGYFNPEEIRRGILSYASPERVAALYREFLFGE
ncbi:MAG: glycosyltransferase family 4 protein [Thermotogae bacterium]|nr:glycosyltransferase family 4 protein [Thermotogota bacterium]